MTSVPGLPLHWLDLALIVLLLWTGTAGWVRGWKVTAWKLGAHLAAFPVAALWRRELQSIVSYRYPADEFIRSVVASRLAVPVLSPAERPVFVWMEAAWDWVHLYPEPALSGWPSLADCVAHALYNSAAFGLAFLAWGTAIYLAGALFLEKGGTPGGLAVRVAGFAAGVARGAFLSILTLGLAVPALFLSPGIWEWGRLSQARFFPAVMHVFNMTGIWWN